MTDRGSGTTGDTDADDAGLADLVSALITASRALIGISAQSLVEVEDAITLSEFRALVVLSSQGSATPSVLARRLGFGADASGRAVARLAELGLVEEADGGLESTASGKELVQSVTARRRVLIADVAARMEQEDRGRVVDALISFAEAAGEPLDTGEGA